MARFKVSAPFTVPIYVGKPKLITTSGVTRKEFSDFFLIRGNWKTYGGTERDVDGVYSVEDTAIVETWYRPDIQSGCSVTIQGSSEPYEIIGKPEDIEQRHQYLRFKVRRISGGA